MHWSVVLDAYKIPRKSNFCQIARCHEGNEFSGGTTRVILPALNCLCHDAAGIEDFEVRL